MDAGLPFPYPLREPQRHLMRGVETALKTGRHAVIEAPTGTGKTVATLHATLSYALPRSLRVLYLTRTNSQQLQVLREAEALGVRAVALEGRRHLCPLVREREELGDATPEELSKFCQKARRDGTCEYGLDCELEVFNVPPAGIYESAVRAGCCPYECAKRCLRHADVVVAPYIFLFHPRVRERFMGWVNAPLSRCIVVVDEAHNLPEYLRSLMSAELGTRTLRMAQEEARSFGFVALGDFPVNVPDFLEMVEDCMLTLSGELEEETPLRGEFAALLMERLGMGSDEIIRYLSLMEDAGEVIRERRLDAQGLWRSYLGAAASFLRAWLSDFDGVRCLDPGGPRLKLLALDPTPLSHVLLECRSSVSISGTLQPLDWYIEVLGLPADTERVVTGNPFPEENLMVLYDDTVTTRYVERTGEMMDRIARKVEDILGAARRNALVVFPSYSLLREVASRVSIPIYTDAGVRDSTSLERAIEMFREKGGTFFTVFGGRVAEGMDFPGDQLELLILVGVPYPKVTPLRKAIYEYYEARFGRGWEFAFEYPAFRRMRQAIGRLIRGEGDRGVVVILDYRAERFANLIEMRRSEDVVGDIIRFFERCPKTRMGVG